MERPIRCGAGCARGTRSVSDADLNEQAERWLEGTTNVRRHGTTRERPQYYAAEFADWAQESEILQGASRRLARDLASGSEPIEGQAVLVLTENGWIHAAMFGK